MKIVLALSVIAVPLAAADPPKNLAIREVLLGDSSHGIGISSFRVVAATPLLTAEINNAIMADDRSGGYFEHSGNQITGSYTCEQGFATSDLVTWTCHGALASADGAGGGYGAASGGALAIVNNRIHPLDDAAVFGPHFDLAKLGALKGTKSSGMDEACTLGVKPEDYQITGMGLLLLEHRDDHYGCMISWDDAKAVLAKDSVIRRVIETPPATDLETESAAQWGKRDPRFVAEADDTVRDLATGLVWMAHDNGADITQPGAAAFAKAKGNGWRLPTENELEELAMPELAHKDAKDCTKGKNDMLLTPLIHISCGIAWSSSAVYKDDRIVAFGFISGTPRIAKPSEKKNYRALLVRKGK
jgi:hypothetical protein